MHEGISYRPVVHGRQALYARSQERNFNESEHKDEMTYWIGTPGNT